MLKPTIRGWCKLEKDYQAQLNRAYNDIGAFVFKIPDNSMTTKPYDMEFVLHDGITYHAELKITKDLSINVSDLRPNQRASLWKISELNPDIAWVFVFSTKSNDHYFMRYVDFRQAANDKGTVKLFNSAWLTDGNQ